VCRHFLRVLERPAIGEIGGDPCRAERVIANWRSDASRRRGAELASKSSGGSSSRARPTGRKTPVGFAAAFCRTRQGELRGGFRRDQRLPAVCTSPYPVIMITAIGMFNSLSRA
jgi:hypothetical protein